MWYSAPGQHIPILLANQGAVLQRNPKQTFFSVNGRNYWNFTHYFNLAVQFNFPSTFNIQPFKMHIYRPKFILASFEQCYQMGGNMLWPDSGCPFLLFSISFSPEVPCSSLGNGLRAGGQDLEAGIQEEGSYILSGVSFLWMNSQGAATTFYKPVHISLTSYSPLYFY